MCDGMQFERLCSIFRTNEFSVKCLTLAGDSSMMKLDDDPSFDESFFSDGSWNFLSITWYGSDGQSGVVTVSDFWQTHRDWSILGCLWKPKGLICPKFILEKRFCAFDTFHDFHYLEKLTDHGQTTWDYMKIILDLNIRIIGREKWIWLPGPRTADDGSQFPNYRTTSIIRETHTGPSREILTRVEDWF